MGNWGTSISSNDTYEDIFYTFFDLYNNGLAADEVTSQIHSHFQEERDSYEDANNFWFALAKAQWDCGSLEKDVLEKVKSIIVDKKDIQLWRELEATNNDIKKRERALEAFLVKLQLPNPKPRRPKKKVSRNAIFKTGDCLVFPLQNGNYGGAFVLDSEIETELGLNVLAITTIKKASRPELLDFKNAEVLVQRDKSFYEYDRTVLQYCYAQHYKKSSVKFEVIGHLPVSRKFEKGEYLMSAARWDFIPTYLENQKDYEERNGKPKTKVRLSDLI
jgi:hypothetical protein